MGGALCRLGHAALVVAPTRCWPTTTRWHVSLSLCLKDVKQRRAVCMCHEWERARVLSSPHRRRRPAGLCPVFLIRDVRSRSGMAWSWNIPGACMSNLSYCRMCVLRCGGGIVAGRGCLKTPSGYEGHAGSFSAGQYEADWRARPASSSWRIKACCVGDGNRHERTGERKRAQWWRKPMLRFTGV